MAPAPFISGIPSAATSTVGTVGTVLVFGMLSASLPAYVDVVRGRKRVSSLSVLPALGQAANFVAWTAYALAQGDATVLQVNLLGCAFAAVYIVVFAVYTPAGAPRARLARLLGAWAVALGGGVCGLFFGLAHGPGAAARVPALGGLAIACNVAMYGAPIGQVRVGLATLNPGALPLLLVAANTLTGAAWLLYGLLAGNAYVLGPNAAGTALNLVQLGAAVYITAAARARPGDVRALPRGPGDEDDDAGGDAGAAGGADDSVKAGLLVNAA